MKTRILLPTLVVLLALGLAACNTPQPLPIAPTVIPTLPPATLPAPESGAPKAPGVNFPVSAPSAAAGQAIFQAKCASCHGVDGKGQVENARDFTDVDYLAAAAPVPKASKPLPKRIFISDWEMKRLVKPGQKSVRIPAGAIVSPLSQDWLDYNGVEILRDR